MTWSQKIGDWFLLEMLCKNLHLELVNILIYKLKEAYQSEQEIQILKSSPYKGCKDQLAEAASNI